MKKTRWIKSMIKEAARTEAEMPWQRGARRTAYIARRGEARAPLKASA